MGLIGGLKPGSRGIKWSEPEQLHFTLKFLGEQPPSLLEKLVPALTETANAFKAFAFALGRGGTFPPKGDPRVLWIGLEEGSEALGLLASSVENACSQLGLERENKPFRPHLTIGRVKATPAQFDREALERGCQGRVRVESFAVVESKLTPAGPIYRTVSEIPLGLN